MAYGTKYTSKLFDHSGATYTVNLKKSSYAGAVTTLNDYSTQPLNLAYRGGREEIDNTVRGSEANFNFYVHETDNVDELISSNYKDWQLEILKATGSTDIISGSTSLHNDTSTGQAWSTSGSTAYNKFTTTTTTTAAPTTTTTTTTTAAPTTTTTTTTTIAPATFSGSFVIHNGSGTNSITVSDVSTSPLFGGDVIGVGGTTSFGVAGSIPNGGHMAIRITCGSNMTINSDGIVATNTSKSTTGNGTGLVQITLTPSSFPHTCVVSNE